MAEINLISFSLLLLLLLIFVILGTIEFKLHSNAINKIQIRNHVNGIRGKSSVVRLIAAGLR